METAILKLYKLLMCFNNFIIFVCGQTSCDFDELDNKYFFK